VLAHPREKAAPGFANLIPFTSYHCFTCQASRSNAASTSWEVKLQWPYRRIGIAVAFTPPFLTTSSPPGAFTCDWLLTNCNEMRSRRDERAAKTRIPRTIC
jgi:hypothetical protein